MTNRLCVVFAVLSACTSDSTQPFVLTGECSRSCFSARLNCHSAGSNEANFCYDYCFGTDCFYCDTVRASAENSCLEKIADACGDPDVPGCAESNFEAVVGGLDKAVRDACRAFAVSCGALEEEKCEHLATVEDREIVVEAYQCLAASCSEEGCVLPAPDLSLAERTCGGIEECGWSCSVEAEILGDAIGWLRQDVRDALEGCLELDCGEGRAQCVAAWLQAVYP